MFFYFFRSQRISEKIKKILDFHNKYVISVNEHFYMKQAVVKTEKAPHSSNTSEVVQKVKFKEIRRMCGKSKENQM